MCEWWRDWFLSHHPADRTTPRSTQHTTATVPAPNGLLDWIQCLFNGVYDPWKLIVSTPRRRYRRRRNLANLTDVLFNGRHDSLLETNPNPPPHPQHPAENDDATDDSDHGVVMVGHFRLWSEWCLITDLCVSGTIYAHHYRPDVKCLFTFVVVSVLHCTRVGLVQSGRTE